MELFTFGDLGRIKGQYRFSQPKWNRASICATLSLDVGHATRRRKRKTRRPSSSAAVWLADHSLTRSCRKPGARILSTLPNLYSSPGFKVWDGSESREPSIGSLSSLLLSEAPPPIADVERVRHISDIKPQRLASAKSSQKRLLCFFIPFTFKVSPLRSEANLASEVSFEFFESFSFDFASSRARAA